MSTALTLASVPAVLAIVNLAKSLGLAGKWSALAAVIVAIAATLAQTLASGPVYEAIATGLILGLSAAGLYDATNSPREDEK